MSALRRCCLCLAAGLVLARCLPQPLAAQTPPVPTVPTAPAALVPPLPPTTSARSPVTLFRDLLSLNPVERRRALTNRPPEIQKRILARLREYDTLQPHERELRLRATELHWYLRPLMTMARTNRATQLARIPDDIRPLVQARLQLWDLMPPPMQREMLDNETTSRYFAQLETATPEERQRLLSNLSPERRAKLEAGIDRWRGLSAEQRDKTLAQFERFFALTPREQEKALTQLSDADRRQMEKTLEAYEKLTPRQREECIRSFEKFAGMSLVERQLFLKNAERWKLMSPAERQAWRSLVNVAPIRPPLASGPTVLPPGFGRTRALATNPLQGRP